MDIVSRKWQWQTTGADILLFSFLSFWVACNLYVFLFYVLMSFCPYKAPASKSVFRFLCQIYCRLRICLFWLLATFMFFILCSYVFLSLPSIPCTSVILFLCQIYCRLRICLFWLLATFMLFILCSYVFLSLPSIRMYMLFCSYVFKLIK